MDSEALAVTRMVAEMEVEQLAKKAAQVEAKLDKANADIEHRKVDLLRLQSEAGSDDSNARQQCETKSAIEREELERATMDEHRTARHLREMLAALEHNQAEISCELREVKAERGAVQRRAQTANPIETAPQAEIETHALHAEADHLRIRAQSMVEELDRVRGNLEHAKCEALRLQSEASDHDNDTVGQQRQRNARTLAMLECKAEDLAAMVSQIETMRVKVLAQADKVRLSAAKKH
jgi:hypothetical protein